ncbi:TMEM175 family protein [Microbacterium sp. RD1]|uniref:TMEM175 family protein n=1 Tax=Microbacterium sp. RD1 TaxID=3457313 RepID=UPI003FA56E89
MIRRRSHPDSTLSTRRLEAYTDGVFAIAATLLVLDLTGRSLEGATSDAALWEALGGLVGPIFTFALSFLLLSLMWVTHVSQFEHIARIDGVGIWINNLRLLFIVLVPFTSSLLTEYSQFFAGRLLLPANFFLAIACSWLQWQWATRQRETMMPDISAAQAGRWGRGSLSALLISGAVLVAAPWLGSFAFLLFLLDGPLTRLLGGGPMMEDDDHPAGDAAPRS